ncbi:phytosulfokines 3-like [Diospyros lotus]|uniref:phytosulfokines 3-like n=1 Tax=Diospyros lotus TaxID=55363 RepID=UPI00225611F0|nr:phytosulfokines 3-like [Diospyros lotus]
MAKATFLLMLALLLCCTLSYAGRREKTPAKTQHGGVEDDHQHVEVAEESCEGVGEEECLMRRTLTAHVDYIYTQKQKP